MMRFARRMNRLGTETAFVVLAKARALEARGKSIIHLEIGEPDFDTPANIKNAAKKALDDGYTHYGPSPGLPQARAAVARYISRTRNVDVTPDSVVITPGGKPILFYSLLALLDEEDEVIYPDPGFPIYESVIQFLGAKAVPLPLREENGFRVNIGDLQKLITKRTRLLILNSPQNPTGSILTGEDLRQIAELAIRHDLIVLSDEIYDRIVYDGFTPDSIISQPGMKERTIILDGFSKTFAMTGWRLGYGVMPEELATQVAKLQTNCTSCTSTFSQIAGIEALEGPPDEMLGMVEEFRKRRDLIVDGLNAIDGIRCHRPGGAFYVFPNITGTGRGSKELEEFFLNEAGVACLSGTAFGTYGDGFLRFSYANSMSLIEKALDRIDRALKRVPVTYRL